MKFNSLNVQEGDLIKTVLTGDEFCKVLFTEDKWVGVPNTYGSGNTGWRRITYNKITYVASVHIANVVDELVALD